MWKQTHNMKNIAQSFLTERKKDGHAYRGEFKHIGFLRMLSIVIAGIFIAGAMETGIFISKHVYGSFQRAEAVVLLKSEMGMEAIDFVQLKRVTDAWTKKYATTTVSIARDPFVAARAGTTSTAP